MKLIHIGRKTRLKFLIQFLNLRWAICLSNITILNCLMERILSNGKNIEYGWLDYHDLKYFKFLNNVVY